VRREKGKGMLARQARPPSRVPSRPPQRVPRRGQKKRRRRGLRGLQRRCGAPWSATGVVQER